MIFSHLLLKNESGLTIDSLQKEKNCNPTNYIQPNLPSPATAQ